MGNTSGIYAFASKLKYGTKYGIWYLGSDLNIYSKVPVLSNIMCLVSKRQIIYLLIVTLLVKIAKSKYGKCEMIPASTKISGIKSKIIKLDKDKVNLLYVGRLEKVKGPDLLVEVAKKLDKNLC